ncbi:hypothetical protein O6P43_020097 [Quillaja saponaria]|uniref:DUF7804 domain-containing protein n=1 Tax=Quillaja saponaria TaxID=32244 RepID=A0AAD7PLV7_QUISA|nr:hypothetical protein O6P43_020097 [Quillaja saponaria]
MALSVGVGFGGNSNVVLDRVGKLSVKNRRCNLVGLWPCSSAIRDRGGSRGNGRISMTSAMATRGLKNRMSLEPLGEYYKEKGGDGNGNGAVDAYGRIDEWMRDSVVEIVKNLREAPLLVQVYTKKTKNDGDGDETRLGMEKKAVIEDWPIVKEKWESGETPLPEGLIFVEELSGDAAEKEEDGGESENGETTTKAWGIVVQGKGVECGPVCYLLKTSRSGSGSGLEMGSTHFCLVRVNSFRETVKSQLKNCWLLQSH